MPFLTGTLAAPVVSGEGNAGASRATPQVILLPFIEQSAKLAQWNLDYDVNGSAANTPDVNAGDIPTFLCPSDGSSLTYGSAGRQNYLGNNGLTANQNDNTANLAGLLVAVVFGVGCSGGGRSSNEPPGSADVLREVGSLLVLYSGEFKKGPARPTDLVRYEQGAPLGYPAVKSGEVVIVWGATMTGESEASNGTTAVIAYEKKTPTEGGLVLLHNSTVRAMTAEEFASAPRAK